MLKATASAAALRCSFTAEVPTSKGQRFHRRQTSIPAVCDREKKSYKKHAITHNLSDMIRLKHRCALPYLTVCAGLRPPTHTHTHTHTHAHTLTHTHTHSHTHTHTHTHAHTHTHTHMHTQPDDSIFSSCHISSVKDYSQRLQ